jgi:hypothetical protein
VSKSFTINQFSATLNCGSYSTGITYSITLSDYGTVPSWISINSATGTIAASSLSVTGTYNVLVIGTTSNYQYTTEAFTLIGLINSAPDFASVIFTQRPQNNVVTTYTLPSIVDPNNLGATVTSGYETGTSAFPSWLSFETAANLALVFNQPPQSLSGSYFMISLVISNSQLSSIETFTVNILNTAPVFASSLTAKTVALC